MRRTERTHPARKPSGIDYFDSSTVRLTLTPTLQDLQLLHTLPGAIADEQSRIGHEGRSNRSGALYTGGLACVKRITTNREGRQVPAPGGLGLAQGRTAGLENTGSAGRETRQPLGTRAQACQATAKAGSATMKKGTPLQAPLSSQANCGRLKTELYPRFPPALQPSHAPHGVHAQFSCLAHVTHSHNASLDMA